VAASSVLLAAAGCAAQASPDPSPLPPPATSAAPSDAATAAVLGSVEAFEEFSGLTVPAAAGNVAVRITSGPTGRPAYRVTFNLPSAGLAGFCRSGRLDRPLDVVTVPASYRKSFDYRGDTSTGVSVASGSRPGDADVQREVLAVGTKEAFAEVRVYAYTVAR